MPWQPLKNIAYGVCIANFAALQPHELSIELGDHVYITEVNGEWARGWLLAPPSILARTVEDTVNNTAQQQAFAGVFPQTHVHVRELLGLSASAYKSAGSDLGDLADLIDTDAVPAHQKPNAPYPPLQIAEAGRQPLVGDIPPCVNEWRATKLPALAAARDYTAIESLATLVEFLDRHRRDLSHTSLTLHELHEVRQLTAWNLVQGNKVCDGQIIVRDPEDQGRLLTADDDIVKLLQLQAAMSMTDGQISHSPSSAPDACVRHLLVTLQGAQALPGSSMLHMYLCVATKDAIRPISETFDIDLPVSDELGIVPAPDLVCRTLFTNVAQSDIPASNSDGSVFLVCILSTTEPCRSAESKTQIEDTNAQGSSYNGSLGRRRRGSEITASPNSNYNNDLAARPSTATSLRSKFTRPQTATSSRKPSVIQTGTDQKLKRAVGWTAVDLNGIMKKNVDSTSSLQFFAPSQSAGVKIDSLLHNLLDRLCTNHTGRYDLVPRMSDLDITLQPYAHDVVEKLVSAKPAQLQGVHQTPAFHVHGTQPRNDVYLTIQQPILPQRTKLFHPQMQTTPFKPESDLLNLQLTLEVRSEDGTRIEDAIAHASNGTSHTAFRTWAIERGEVWNQTIRISLPAELISKAHIVMSIADGPGFPFALAWYPLWTPDSGFVPDGLHCLALWDYSEYTVSRVNGKGAYQNLASEAKDLDPMEHMAQIAVQTRLSSTTATQDPTILELLETGKDSDVLPIMKRFHTIPDHELAKFFLPLIHVLDGILARDASSTQATISETTLLAFKCLTILYTLIRDFRYPHLRKLLDTHIHEQQLPPLSRIQSIKILRSLLSNAFAAGRDLRSALKVADITLKAAVPPKVDDADKDDETFMRQECIEFFDDLTVLLQNTSQLTLPTQVVVMQHFPSWLARVQTLLDAPQVLKIAIATIDACSITEPQSKLQRLAMIHQLDLLDLFTSGVQRDEFITLTIGWLSSYWPRTSDLNDKDKAAVRLCCTIIKDQRHRLQAEHVQTYVRCLVNAYHHLTPPSKPSKKPQQTRRGKFSQLYPHSYPFQTYTVKVAAVPSEGLLEIIALLGSFFQVTTDTHAVALMALSTSLDDDLARQVLELLHSIQAYDAFPATWLSMMVSFSRCQINILKWLLSYLTEALPVAPSAQDLLEFSGELWSSWFKVLSGLVNSQAVTMEYQSDQKRAAVWTIGGDIRQMAADLVHEAWQALGWEADATERALYRVDRVGGYQHEFTEELVPSIVLMGLSLHNGLRSMAIETLHSMVVGLWQTSGDLGVIQSAFVDSFDAAFRQKTFEPAQAVMLLQALGTSFEDASDGDAAELHAAVAQLTASTSHLVELMSAIHSRGGKAVDSEQHIELIQFLQTLQNHHAFVRHVHDFVSAQIESRDYASAAMAIQMHVNYNNAAECSPDEILPAIKGVDDIPAQTMSQRQQGLLTRMTHFFRLGHCWSDALSTLDESLANCHAQFDAAGISRVHREQAEIYSMLHGGEGFKLPRHFRVLFGTSAVKDSRAGKGFIYETEHDEDTETFAKRIRRQSPSAIIVSPGSPAPRDANAESVIKISNVSINKAYAHPANRMRGISPFFRTYHLSAKAYVFSTSTRQEKPDQLASEATVTKDVFWTKETFPTLIGRSEIVRNEQLTLSPVQAAIDRTLRKTMDIAETNLAVKLEALSSRVESLLRLIKSSVDPDSDSVIKYRKLLDSNTSETRPSTRSGRSATIASQATDLDERDEPVQEDAELLVTLAVALEDHAQAIEEALGLCLNRRSEQARELRDKFEEMFEAELGTMYASGSWRLESPLWTATTYESLAPENDAVPIEEGETDVETERARRPSWRRRRSSSIRTRLSFLGLGSGSPKDKG